MQTVIRSRFGAFACVRGGGRGVTILRTHPRQGRVWSFWLHIRGRAESVRQGRGVPWQKLREFALSTGVRPARLPEATAAEQRVIPRLELKDGTGARKLCNLPKLNTTTKEAAPLVSLEQLLVDIFSHEQVLVDVPSCPNRNRSVTEKESVPLM